MTNEDFAKLVDTSDEWITRRTGIKRRHFAAPDEATSDLALNAARGALEAAAVDPADLDLVIVGTLTPDFYLPSCAVLVQDALGAKRAGAFDVAAACTGFLTAMQTGEAFIASGRAKRVLVIGAEVLSRYLDMNDRTSCILFGDAAGAAVLMPHADCGQGRILEGTCGADGSAYEVIHMRGGGSRNPPTHESIDRGDHNITLRGRDVYRFAVNKLADLIREMTAGYDPDEIGLVVPHQVNARIIESAIERAEVPREKVLVNIDEYGNTSAATVPVALHEALQEGRLEKGKLVVLVAFGAGLTWAASLVRW
jgi:3-oxoacyl-[acyl-carrier-protein] synthase-3